MAERILGIEAFRNIGLKKEDGSYKPYETTLVLDRNFEKGKTGGLVFLIGENGAGKSNTLDAVKMFSYDYTFKSTFDTNDLTRLCWDQECRHPKISVSCEMADSTLKKQHYRITKEFPSATQCSPEPKDENASKREELKEKLFLNLNTLCDIEASVFVDIKWGKIEHIESRFQKIRESLFRCYGNKFTGNFKIDINHPYPSNGAKVYDSFLNQIQGQITRNIALSEEEIKTTKEQILDVFTQYKWALERRNDPEYLIFDSSKYFEFLHKVRESLSLGNLDFLFENESYIHFKRAFYEEYQLDIVKNACEYKRDPFSDKDLSIPWQDLQRNRLFAALSQAIGMGIEEIEERYQLSRSTNSFGILKDLQEDMNDKMFKVSDDFNRLYNSHIKYSFALDFGKDEVNVLIKKGKQCCVLKTESEGFRYFFDLYFGLLFSKEWGPGDIITMDEPAEKLSVPALKEIRNFLKDFAFRNGILIVCATHSPFLISADNLDELRLVYCDKDGITTIENEYSLLSNHTHATQEIKRALTTENYQIIKPDSKYIFVESMDDYNITTAFKQVLGETDIYFFPIGKVDDNTDIEKLLSEISRLHKQNPVILLPKGDTYNKINTHCSKPGCNALVLNYNCVGASTETIRDFFTSDISTLNDGTYYFKNHIQNIEKDLLDSTRNKFRDLFDNLKKEMDE
jgi:ABC-type multidrug transport system ATPase subunit